jgi:ClpP class serine protease
LQSDEGINTIKSELQKLADIFIAVVARNRNQSIEHVRENFGQGGTMLANDSIAVGMTDAIGSLETILTNKNIKGGHTMDEFIKNAITDDEKDEEKDTKKVKKSSRTR